MGSACVEQPPPGRGRWRMRDKQEPCCAPGLDPVGRGRSAVRKSGGFTRSSSCRCRVMALQPVPVHRLGARRSKYPIVCMSGRASRMTLAIPCRDILLLRSSRAVLAPHPRAPPPNRPVPDDDSRATVRNRTNEAHDTPTGSTDGCRSPRSATGARLISRTRSPRRPRGHARSIVLHRRCPQLLTTDASMLAANGARRREETRGCG